MDEKIKKMRQLNAELKRLKDEYAKEKMWQGRRSSRHYCTAREYLNNVKNVLDEYKEKRGLSLGELALEADVPYSVLINLHHGNSISLTKFLVICHNLGISPNEMTEWDNQGEINDDR